MQGPIIACLVVAWSTVALPCVARGQERERRTYGSGAPEAKLMLYYSSTLAFSPVGVPFGAEGSAPVSPSGTRKPARFEAAMEVSYLPPLSAEQRTAGLDKPEATNLAPVFARPRVSLRLPGGAGVELSWIPPVRVFDVKANLFAVALSRGFEMPARVRVVPRVAVLGGRVEGPITCNRETAREGGAALASYFAFVCYGNESRDYLEPRHLSGEVMLARSPASGRWQTYVLAGARTERTRFDIGVIRRDGSREPDHPRLEVRTTRTYGAAGASWLAPWRTRVTTELYYAPGSVLTVRGLAGVRLW